MDLTALHLQLIDSPTTLSLGEFTLSVLVQFQPTSDLTSWGFVPAIVDSSVDLKNIQVSLENSFIPAIIVDSIVDAITPFLSNIINSAIKKTVAQKIVDYTSSSVLSFEVPVNGVPYQLQARTTETPKIVDSNYVNLAIDFLIVNQLTGESPPYFDNGEILERMYPGFDDLEIMVGGNLLDEIVWTLLDSGMLDLTLNDDQIEQFNLPLSLTTTGMKLLVPQFA